MLHAFLIFTMRATFPAHFTSFVLHTEINKLLLGYISL